MNKEVKELFKQVREILDKYPNRQTEILFYIFGEDTIKEILNKPTYEKLQAKVNQLETNRDEVLEMINTQVDDLETDSGMWKYYIEQIQEILERGKE